MKDKMLGRIARASFGFGGYQGAQFGLSLELRGPDWGVGHFDGFWSGKPSSGAQWTADDQAVEFGNTCQRLVDLLREAKVQSVDQLVGRPIEATFEGTALKGFRILSEVL